MGAMKSAVTALGSAKNEESAKKEDPVKKEDPAPSKDCGKQLLLKPALPKLTIDTLRPSLWKMAPRPSCELGVTTVVNTLCRDVSTEAIQRAVWRDRNETTYPSASPTVPSARPTASPSMDCPPTCEIPMFGLGPKSCDEWHDVGIDMGGAFHDSFTCAELAGDTYGCDCTGCVCSTSESKIPSTSPTRAPTTDAPSASPSRSPSASPTAAPSTSPTLSPSPACEEGTGRDPATGACAACAKGTFSTWVRMARRCKRCRDGTFSRAGASECEVCPESAGVRCVDGVLRPKPGYWTPATLPEIVDNAPLAGGTPVFACLGDASDSACRVGDYANASVSPENAYACAPGHGGVLCASCDDKYFFKKRKCVACKEGTVSSGAVAAIVSLLCVGGLLLVGKVVARRFAPQLIATLHGMRKRLHLEALLHKQAASMRARQRHAVGATGAGDRVQERRRGSHFAQVATMLQAQGVRAVHTFVKSAQRNYFSASESLRCVLNAAKVITHLLVKKLRRVHYYRRRCLQILIFTSPRIRLLCAGTARLIIVCGGPPRWKESSQRRR